MTSHMLRQHLNTLPSRSHTSSPTCSSGSGRARQHVKLATAQLSPAACFPAACSMQSPRQRHCCHVPLTLSVASTYDCTCGLMRHSPAALPCQGDPSQLRGRGGGAAGLAGLAKNEQHSSKHSAASRAESKQAPAASLLSALATHQFCSAHLMVGPTSLTWSVNLSKNRSCHREPPCGQGAAAAQGLSRVAPPLPLWGNDSTLLLCSQPPLPPLPGSAPVRRVG